MLSENRTFFSFPNTFTFMFWGCGGKCNTYRVIAARQNKQSPPTVAKGSSQVSKEFYHEFWKSLYLWDMTFPLETDLVNLTFKNTSKYSIYLFKLILAARLKKHHPAWSHKVSVNGAEVTSEQVALKSDVKLTDRHCASINSTKICAGLAHLERSIWEVGGPSF